MKAWTPIALGALLAGCSVGTPARQGSGPPPAVKQAALDPTGSPVPFRHLDAEAILVAPKTGDRSLAALGNYLEHSLAKTSQARVSVWDDEDAWKRSSTTDADDESVLAHKRAEYVKDLSPPEPVDRHLVFDSQGHVAYQRDFRAWPLADADLDFEP